MDRDSKDTGVSTPIHMDGAKEFIQGHWQRDFTQHGGFKQTIDQLYSPW